MPAMANDVGRWDSLGPQYRNTEHGIFMRISGLHLAPPGGGVEIRRQRLRHQRGKRPVVMPSIRPTGHQDRQACTAGERRAGPQPLQGQRADIRPFATLHAVTSKDNDSPRRWHSGVGHGISRHVTFQRIAQPLRDFGRRQCQQDDAGGEAAPSAPTTVAPDQPAQHHHHQHQQSDRRQYKRA